MLKMKRKTFSYNGFAFCFTYRIILFVTDNVVFNQSIVTRSLIFNDKNILTLSVRIYYKQYNRVLLITTSDKYLYILVYIYIYFSLNNTPYT